MGSSFGLLWLRQRPAVAGRVVRLGAAFVGVFVLTFWLGWLLVLSGVWTPEGGYPKVDFFAYWAGSSLALKGMASSAYDVAIMANEQVQLPGDDNGFLEWLYPPTFFLYVLPLSLLPMSLSMAAWSVSTFAVMATALKRIYGSQVVVLLAVAFPATMWNLLIGQNGFLTAGLLAWGVILLKDRPIAAGVVLGLLVYKPQFFPLVLVGLLAGGQRRALASLAGTVLVLVIFSVVLFGLDSWAEFVQTVRRSGDQIYEGVLPLDKMQSVSAALLLLGLPVLTVKIAQAAAVVFCIAATAWIWRRDLPIEYKAAALALGIMLSTPYLYHYDLTLLGLACVWLARRFQVDGWKAGDAEVVLLAWFAPIAYLAFGTMGIPAGPIIILSVVLVLARRIVPPTGQPLRPQVQEAASP